MTEADESYDGAMRRARRAEDRVRALEAELRDARIDAAKERSLTAQHGRKERRLEAEFAEMKDWSMAWEARAEAAEARLAELLGQLGFHGCSAYWCDHVQETIQKARRAKDGGRESKEAKA